MRTMLLPFASDETDKSDATIGLTLAAKLNVRPTFLLLRPRLDGLPIYAHLVGTAGYAAMLYDLQSHTELREASVKEELSSACKERGLKLDTDGRAQGDADVFFVAYEGDPDEAIRRLAAVHDMVVIPRYSRPDEALEVSSLLKSALEYSGRPILVVTDVVADDFGSMIAIAWNGSTEGARAVTGALPLLKQAKGVTIFTVGTAKTDAQEGERLRRYLLHHGVSSHTRQFDADGNVGENLISAANLSGACLLISGGYTHSRLRQSIFGGVTHHLLENCRLPLFLAH